MGNGLWSTLVENAVFAGECVLIAAVLTAAAYGAEKYLKKRNSDSERILTTRKGTSTAFVGDLANFVIGCSFILPASVIYMFKKTKKNAILSSAAGTFCMTVFGTMFNAVYLLPAFSRLYGMPLDTIVGMGTAINGSITSVTTLVIFAVAPMNLLKGGSVSL